MRVKHLAGFSFGPRSEYDLRITRPDGYEPDDIFAPARLIAVGTTYRHNEVDSTDGWVMTIQLPYSAVGNTNRCRFETVMLGRKSDTEIELYIQDGTLPTYLGYDDDSGLGYGSRIEHTAPISGVASPDYYIRVYQNSSRVYGPETHYSLLITQIPAS